MRIAVADDEPEILRQLVGALTGANHHCDSFVDGAALMTALQRDTYDVVLLDWNMPRASGLEVLEWAQETLDRPPAFILITSRSSEADVVGALKKGASDYLIKPQPDSVVVARIEAAVKSSKTIDSSRYGRFGSYKFDRSSKTISVAEQKAQLTSEEFNLAMAFFANTNRPLSRHYLSLEVWGEDANPEPKDLDRMVSRLRHKVSIRPDNGFAISSVFGFGYRMEAVEPE